MARLGGLILLLWAGTAFPASLSFDWDDAIHPSGTTAVDYGVGTVNLDFSVTGAMPGGRPANLNTYNNSGGFGNGQSNVYGVNSGATATAQFQFSDAVTSLDFSIYDVDNSDTVTVRAFNGASEITLGSSQLSAESGSPTFTLSGNVASGSGSNSGANSTAGTLNVSIAGPVTRITVAGTASGTSSFLFAISDIDFVADDPPAADCSVALDRLDWDSQAYPAGDLSETFSVSDVSPFPDVDFSFSYAGNTADFVANSPEEVTSFTTTADGFVDSPTIELLHDPNPDSDSPVVTLTIDLSDTLTDVRFSLADVDSNTPNDFIDEVRVRGFDNGTQRDPVFEAHSEGSSFGFGSDTVTGHSFSDGTENNARSTVSVYFDEAIDQIEIRYDDDSGDGGDRKILLSDILYCPPSSLPVTLTHFDSRPDKSQWRVEWQTATQTLHAGFELQARAPSDGVVLARHWVPSRAHWSAEPQSYRLVLDALPVDAELALISHDITGRSQSYGPFAPGLKYGERVQRRPIPWQRIRTKASDRLAGRGLELSRDGLRRSPARGLKDAATGAYAEIDREGIYRVHYEDLTAAGVDLLGATEAELAVSFRGAPIARRAQIHDPVAGFGPGDYLDFFAVPPAGEDAVYLSGYRYEITLNPSLVRAAAVNSGRAQAPLVTRYRATTRIEHDRVYDFASPTGDPWYDRSLLSFAGQPPASADLIIPVHDLRPIGNARLTLELVGVTDFEGGPDHHVRAYLNGAPGPIIEARSDGLAPFTITRNVAASALREGDNTLRLEVPGDTGFPFDLVWVDAFSASYPRELIARGDSIDFSATANGFEIRGFSRPELVAYAVDDDGGLTALAVEVGAVGASFEARVPGIGVDGERVFSSGFEAAAAAPGNPAMSARYFVSTEAALLRPPLSPRAPAPPPRVPGGTDYLVIAHPAFLGADLDGYLAARAADGFRPFAVDLYDLYESYTHGMALPSAVTAFLADARDEAPVSHALLVGADSSDYRDFLGLGSVSFVPTRYALTAGLIHFTPADGLLADLDGDEVPELALGRWPVRTLDDLRSTIGKTLDYRNSGLSSGKSAVLIAADTAPGAPPFSGQTERLGRLLVDPGGLPWNRVTRIDLDRLAATMPAAQVVGRAQELLTATINAGATLTVFAGHGSPDRWISFLPGGGVMTPTLAASLNNPGLPTLMLPLTCYTSYWVDPGTDTLAYRLLNAGDRGAVAISAASVLSTARGNEDFAAIVIGEMMNGATLGEAVLTARQRLAAADGKAYRDVIVNWTLLGDPTLRLGSG